MAAAGLDRISQQATAAGAHEALPLAIVNTLEDGSLDIVPTWTTFCGGIPHPVDNYIAIVMLSIDFVTQILLNSS